MMRKLYIDTMKGLCGEETGKYCEQKCIIQNSEACPKNNSTVIKDVDISDCDKLVGAFKCRKYAIYYASISMLMHYKERGIDKIRRSFKIFEESADKICVIFILHEAVFDYLEQIDAGVYSKLKGIVLNLHDAKNIVYDSEGVALRHMDKWDAYYGDSSARYSFFYKKAIS